MGRGGRGRRFFPVGISRDSIRGPKLSYLAGGRVKTIEAAANCAHPDETSAVLSDGPDVIAAESGGGVSGIVLVADKAVVRWVKEVQAGVGSDPEAAVAIFIEAEDAGAGERVGVGGVVKIADKFITGVEVLIKAIFSSNPESAEAVGEEGVYPGVGERARVAFYGEVNGEFVAVKFVKAGFGSEPKKAMVVAGYGKDRILRQALFNGQRAEEKMRAQLGKKLRRGKE